MMRRIQIEPDDFPPLVHQRRGVGELKTLRAVWLQTEGAPDAADGGLAQSGPGRQRAAGPVGGSLRRLLHGEPHHSFDLLIANLTRGSWTWLIAHPGDAFHK